MKKTLSIFAGLALLLAGCGSTGGKDKSDELIVYTNSGADGRAEWLIEKSEEQGFNIKIVEGAGSDLTDRLIAEKNNPIADLVYGLDTIEYEKLKADDMLVEYTPEWASEVDETLGDGQYYYPIETEPLVWIYNEDKLGDRPVPTDMLDFLEPEFEDAYSMRAHHGGTGKTVLASLLVRYADESGELGISDEGWEVVEQFIKNAHYEVLGEDLYGDIISGERPIGLTWSSGVMQTQEERDFEFDVMTPDIGVPFIVQHTAVIDEDKKDLAVEWINWFGSAEVQAERANKFFLTPANEAALEQTTGDIKEFAEKVKPQDIDWALISKNVDMWVEKVELEYME